MTIGMNEYEYVNKDNTSSSNFRWSQTENIPSLEEGRPVPLESVCERWGQREEGWHSSGPAWMTASGSPNLSPVGR